MITSVTKPVPPPGFTDEENGHITYRIKKNTPIKGQVNLLDTIRGIPRPRSMAIAESSTIKSMAMCL